MPVRCRTPWGHSGDPLWTPKGSQMDPKRIANLIPNGSPGDPVRTPYGPQMRMPNHPPGDPLRTLYGSQKDSKWTPDGSQTLNAFQITPMDPKRIPNPKWILNNAPGSSRDQTPKGSPMEPIRSQILNGSQMDPQWTCRVPQCPYSFPTVVL